MLCMIYPSVVICVLIIKHNYAGSETNFVQSVANMTNTHLAKCRHNIAII